MRALPCLALIAAALATSAHAADGDVYRCTTNDGTAWQGVPDVSTNAIIIEPGRLVFVIDTAAGKFERIFDGSAIGAAEDIEVRRWAGEGTQAVPQIVAASSEGNFTLRIALDNDPLRFALLYPATVLTGTCVIETESKDK
jgi:hypothetical protein